MPSHSQPTYQPGNEVSVSSVYSNKDSNGSFFIGLILAISKHNSAINLYAVDLLLQLVAKITDLYIFVITINL